MSGLWGPLVSVVRSFWDRRQRRGEDIERQRAAARVKFRAAVLEALDGLFPEAPKWPGPRIDPMLKDKYSRLQRAVEEFRPFVPAELQDQFERSWVAYYSSFKGYGRQDYGHYQSFTGVRRAPDDPERLIETVQDGKANFKTNVAALLAFANQNAR